MTTPDFERVRADFPRARTAGYFDNASSHPISVHSAKALHSYMDWVTHNVCDPWWPDWPPPREEARRLFARLIHANPAEIVFARSTVEAESNLLNGMADHLAGGNVVTNDLAYSACLCSYKVREAAGLEVRIVRNRDWRIDMDAMAAAIDKNTRLVSVALVSNINGFLADVPALSELAHARGAYLYADIMQAVGAVPIDVEAMGIDMAACSTFKWLMGVKGFGFLYVRRDLQETVVKASQPSGSVRFNYPPWVDGDDGGPDVVFRTRDDATAWEVSYPSYEGVICAQQSLRYILDLGVDNIRGHVRGLTDRLQEELPAKGYRPITPRGNESPILAFVTPDPEAAVRRTREAGVHVAMRFGDKLRLSPSVYNNQEDVSRLIEALP